MAIASRPFYSAEIAHAYYILSRGGSVFLSVRRRSGVLRVKLPLALTMPPSKVRPLYKAKIRQKVCKSCLSSQKKSRAYAYYRHSESALYYSVFELLCHLCTCQLSATKPPFDQI